MRFNHSKSSGLSPLRLPLIIVLLVMLVTGCEKPQKKTHSEASPTPSANVSSRGIVARSATLPDAPKRIVSMAPNITETLFAIGAEEELVGVTRFCDFPKAVEKLPRVGGLIDPDLEAIAALEPDLILGVTSSGNATIVERLDALDIPYAFLRMEDLDETFQGIRTVGALTAHAKTAKALADDMQRDVARFEAREKLHEPPTVLMVFGRKPIIAAGPGTFADDLLTRAGGKNVLADTSEAYPQLDLEGVIALNPDRIIEISMTPGHEDDFWEKFDGLHAVEDGNVFVFDDPALMRPGPRLIDGFRKVALAIRGKHTAH